MLTLTNDNIDTKEIPISLEHLMIVYFTVYRLISSVTAVKSIGSAKPGKARVINFKARVKPKARASEITGLFSITTLDQSKNVTVRTFHIWPGSVHEHIFLALGGARVPWRHIADHSEAGRSIANSNE